MRLLKLYILLLFLISEQLYSQSGSFGSAPDTEAPESMQQTQEIKELPAGYRSILLGMTFSDVKDRLLVEPRFDFRGDPDVSIQKTGSQSLISSKGRMFIDQGFFQFENDKLFLIILEFNRDKIDFFTMQQSLTSRYGPPGDVSPEGMTWSNGKTKLSLEYPLTLKYLDEEVFNSFLAEEERLKSFQEVSRTDFLEDF